LYKLDSANSNYAYQKNRVISSSTVNNGIYSSNNNHATFGVQAIPAAFSISYWVNADPTSYLNYGTPQFGWGSYGTGKGFQINAPGNGYNGAYVNKLTLSLYDPSISYFASTPNWTTGWHHIVVTYGATNKFNVYLDNVLIITGTQGLNSPGTQVISSGPGYGTSQVAQTIDEINIWDRELSSTEVESLFNVGSGVAGDVSLAPFNTGLLYGWHLDELSGSIAYPFYGIQNGTLVGTASFVPGKIALSGAYVDSTVWSSKDGTPSAGESAINTFGDAAGRTIVDGKTIRLNTNGIEKIQIQSDNNIYFPVQDANTKFNINDGGVTRTAIQINGAEGSVSFPRQSMVSAVTTGDASINPSVWTTVSFPSEYYDTLNEWETNTFTPKTSGTYLFIVRVHWTSLGGGTWVQYNLTNSTPGNQFYYESIPSTQTQTQKDTTLLANLVAGTPYSFQVQHNNGTAQTIRNFSNTSAISIVKVA